MPNPDLNTYVTDSRRAGSTDREIRTALLAAGWSESDVHQVLPIRKRSKLWLVCVLGAAVSLPIGYLAVRSIAQLKTDPERSATVNQTLVDNNAVRAQTLAKVAKVVYAYVNNPDPSAAAPLPDTGQQQIPLNDASKGLLAVPAIREALSRDPSLVLTDPGSSGYTYGFVSDGKSYRLIAVQTSDSDEKKVIKRLVYEAYQMTEEPAE